MSVRSHNGVCATILLFTCTMLLTVAAYGEGTLPGDVAISRFIQQLDVPAANTIERLGYWLGSLWPIIVTGVVIALLCAAARLFVEAILVIGIVVARGLNPLLKWMIESPRPTTDDVRVTEIASNYGFPSGHVMGTVLVFGSAIYVAQVAIDRYWLRRGVQLLCALVILITSFARIHSGAHWPSDVLGGYLWGLTILLVMFTTGPRLASWLTNRRRYVTARSPGRH